MGNDRVDIGYSGPMHIDQANNTIRIITKFTKEYSAKVNALITRLEAIDPKDRARTSAIESEVGQLIEHWNQKIRKLGGIPKGLWLVDIDAGDGYYCWKYPEVEVGYWHEYKSGYTGRIPLAERENAKSEIKVPINDESRTSSDQPTPW